MSRGILVTGASGLIGRNVVAALRDAGEEVHAVTRSLTQESRDGEVRWHKANLLDHRERVQVLDAAEPQTVIHCAWVTEHGAYWTSPENLDWIGATLSLAHEARERGVARFLGVGTCAEYKWGSDEPLNEARSPIEPATLYGVAKDATRRVLETYAAQSGLSFAWARIFMLYGAGEHPSRFVAALARALTRGQPANMASGRGRRDLLDARDVGAALAAIAASSATGAFNIASGSAVPLEDIGEALARIAGKPDLLKIGALPDRPDEPAAIAADATRLSREIAFRPRISLEQGLSDALAYWRARA